MSICNRCDRFFVYKNSLRRHQQKRHNPCRLAVASCTQCGNKFTSFESLKKHKKLYWKGEQHYPEINQQDFLNQLPSANVSPHNNDDHHHQLHTPQSVADFTPVPNTYFDSDTLQELLNQIQFSPIMTHSINNNVIRDEEYIIYLLFMTLLRNYNNKSRSDKSFPWHLNTVAMRNSTIERCL